MCVHTPIRECTSSTRMHNSVLPFAICYLDIQLILCLVFDINP